VKPAISSSPRRRSARLVAASSVTALCVVAAGAAGTSTAAAEPQSPAATPALPIYLDTHYSFQERAADLVSRMTLPEKVQQLHTNNAPAIPRLGVQQYTYWSEGQHGVNTLGANTNPGDASGGVHSTSFPTNFASTMSWDKSLMYDETTAISDEARGFLDKSLWDTGQNNIGPSPADYGSLTYWAPTVNMDRDPRWGRTDEAFGEDPYLVGQMAGEFVDGYEGESQTGQPTSKYLKVASTAKHYALNNTDNDRTSESSNVDDQTLRQYYTAQFKSLIENSHVSGLMTSYNAINGTPAVADTYTVNQLAQRTFGFDGYITSDCGAVGTTYQNPPGGHDWAPPGWTTDSLGSGATWTNTATGTQIAGAAGGQAYALRAGTNLNCTGEEDTLGNIQQAIDAGVLSEGVIDTALVRLFTIRMRTGEFDPPSNVPYTKITKDVIQSAAHQALAEKVAANSLVLLKNDSVAGTSAPLLPASASKLNKVVVLGNLANTVTLGGYSGDPALRVSAMHGITAAIRATNPSAQVIFDAANTSTTSTSAAVLSAQTQDDIKSADLVIVFVGTDDAVAGEGHDRASLAMPGNYDSLITQTAALGNPKMALVIQSDGPVKIDDVQASFPAIVFSGYNGESQGAALADVLLGNQNPSGHLDFTWFKDDSQLPAMSNYGITAADTGGLGRTYQYFTGTPTYPFGYGLSYAKFAYSHVVVNKKSASANDTVQISFDVTNTGATPGATVGQVYVATPFTVPGVELPAKRLAGFQKTAVLKPGGIQHITISIKISDLSFWDATNMKSVVYDGAYAFQVGSDSSHIAAAPVVNVSGSLTPTVQYVTVQPENVVYNAGDSFDLTGKNKWIKDDTDPTLEQRNLSVTADNVVEAVNSDQSFVDLAHANAQYASSNTAVATVSPTGHVTAVGDGVATITATVNGVSGSAVMVVHHEVKIDAPSLMPAGTSAQVTTTLVNAAGAAPLSNVSLTLGAPSGWTATATSPSTFSQVASGQTVQTTWNLTAPSDAAPGSYQLTAQATFQSGSDSSVHDVSVPYASFKATFNNIGVSDDSQPGSGNLDGGGFSYSAQALAAAGVTPGGAIAHDGLTFTWPDAAPGAENNAVAGGQAFAFSGSGSTLGLLGTGDYGAASGTATITYTDGSTQSFTLSYSDWWSNSAMPGGDIFVSTPYINGPSGQQNQKVSIYYASAPLQAGKTVQYLTLPNVSARAMTGQTAMHVFAIAVG
jgi:beta-glucosidase